MFASALALFVLLGCVINDDPIERVKIFRQLKDDGDLVQAKALLAPNARIYFEKKEGPGEPYTIDGDRYKHWDDYFHSRPILSDWRVDADGSVVATVHETNDFYKLLEWTPKPYAMRWWFDEKGLIKEVMIQSLPGESKSRMKEFQEWARANRPEELEYLMPKGRIDPTGDRAERWVKIIGEWKASKP